MAEMLPKADYWALDNSIIKAAIYMVVGLIVTGFADMVFNLNVGALSGLIIGAGFFYILILLGLQEHFFTCKTCRHRLHKHEDKNGVKYAACKGKGCTCIEFVQTVKPLTKEGAKALDTSSKP